MASALQGRLAQMDAVRLLLKRGADPSAKNLEHEQPAQLVPNGPLGDQVREHQKTIPHSLRALLCVHHAEHVSIKHTLLVITNNALYIFNKEHMKL